MLSFLRFLALSLLPLFLATNSSGLLHDDLRDYNDTASEQDSISDYFNGSKKSSTLGARISLPGLQFFSNIGHKIVTRELPRLELPNISLPISGGPGTGTVKVGALKLSKFESPRFRFKLAPPDGITWNSVGGNLRLTGSWEADYTVLVTVYLSGTVDVTASDIQSTLTLGAYGYKQHPQIDVYNCTADVKHLHMSLKGSFITKIINLFRANLASAIQSAIHEQFCNLVKTVLLTEANEALLTLPTRVEITNNIFLDYGLLHNPSVTSRYVQGDALIDVTIGNNSCAVPFVPVKMDAPEKNRYMANFWFSQSIVNCLLASAHESKKLYFVLNKDLKHDLDTFLRTTCMPGSICLGTFFKILREKYPNNSIDMVFESDIAPACQISPDDIRLVTIFNIDFHINPSDQNPDVLARLQMVSNSTMDPALFNNRLVGKLSSTTLKFSQVSSKIGNFSPLMLRAFESILKPMIILAADTVFRVGIPIPLVENVTLDQTSRLVKLQNEIRLDANLVYV